MAEHARHDGKEFVRRDQPRRGAAQAICRTRRPRRWLGVKRFSPGDGGKIRPRSVLLSSVLGCTKSGSGEDDAMATIQGRGVAATLILSGAGLAFLLFTQPA